MRVLIVDDEAPARARLRRLLAPYPDLLVVGEAAHGAQALEQVAALAPDVVFLDVQMPQVSGLEVAASLPDDGPVPVFVTAHDRYALQAFDARALDYLLKPVDPARLQRTVERLRGARAPRRPTPPPAQLLVPRHDGLQVVACADIEWLQAADNYVVLHVGGREHLLRRTLAGLLDDLGPAFVRVHRSAGVALAHVAAVQTLDKGDARLTLHSGAQVLCSRAWRAELLRRLQG